MVEVIEQTKGKFHTVFSSEQLLILGPRTIPCRSSLSTKKESVSPNGVLTTISAL